MDSMPRDINIKKCIDSLMSKMGIKSINFSLNEDFIRNRYNELGGNKKAEDAVISEILSTQKEILIKVKNKSLNAVVFEDF